MKYDQLEEGKDYLVRGKGGNWDAWHDVYGLLRMRIERDNGFKMCCFYTEDGQLHSKRNPMVAEKNFELVEATNDKAENNKKIQAKKGK